MLIGTLCFMVFSTSWCFVLGFQGFAPCFIVQPTFMLDETCLFVNSILAITFSVSQCNNLIVISRVAIYVATIFYTFML